MPKVLKSSEREMDLKVKGFCEADVKNGDVMIYLQKVGSRTAAMTDQIRHYDNALSRLVVTWNDSYRGISPYMFGSDFNPEPPIFACRFAEKEGYEHYVAIANEDGRVAIQDTFKMDTKTGDHSPLEGVQCHENAVFDLAWRYGSMQFVTVSGDHTARLWDLGEGSIRQSQVFYGHCKSVKTVAFRPQDHSVFATGARDGKILIWDIRANSNADVVARPDNSIFNCHPIHLKTPTSTSKRALRITEHMRANSITGLVFQTDDTLISCTDGDGNIKIWDMRKNYSVYKKDPLPKQSIPYCGCSSMNGYTNLIFDKSRYVLYANCMDNVIYSFNVTTYNAVPLERYVGHMNGTFYIKSSLSPDGLYLISGSSDEKAYIWNVKYSQPIVQLEGHSAEVTCATWCQYGDIKIVTCSDDARHKIWRIHKEIPEYDDVVYFRGTSKKYPANKTTYPTLDQTPQSLKRKSESVETSSKKKCTGKSPINKFGLSRKTSKRSLLDMLNGTLPSVKEENDENEINIMNVSPFDIDEPSTSKRHCPDSYLEGLQHLIDSDFHEENSHDTIHYNSANMIFTTPKKSPRKLTISPMKSPQMVSSSPGLAGFEFPNFVLNGDAPHLGLMSPPKKMCKNVDWLTRLSLEKNSKTGNASVVSPQSSNTTQRKNSASKSSTGHNESINGNKTPTRNKVNTSLLNYFSSSSKSVEKNK